MKYIKTHGDEPRLFRWARKYLYQLGLVRYHQRPFNAAHHAMLDALGADIRFLRKLKRKSGRIGSQR